MEEGEGWRERVSVCEWVWVWVGVRAQRNVRGISCMIAGEMNESIGRRMGCMKLTHT